MSIQEGENCRSSTHLLYHVLFIDTSVRMAVVRDGDHGRREWRWRTNKHIMRETGERSEQQTRFTVSYHERH